FQAEDGIRDDLVTGVQTCALPIFPDRAIEVTSRSLALPGLYQPMRLTRYQHKMRIAAGLRDAALALLYPNACRVCGAMIESWREIGRASCREGGEVTVGVGTVEVI